MKIDINELKKVSTAEQREALLNALLDLKYLELAEGRNNGSRVNDMYQEEVIKLACSSALRCNNGNAATDVDWPLINSLEHNKDADGVML